MSQKLSTAVDGVDSQMRTQCGTEGMPMTDDDAKELSELIENILDQTGIRVTPDHAKRIVATISMLEAVGMDTDAKDPDMFMNGATIQVIPSIVVPAPPYLPGKAKKGTKLKFRT